MARAIDLGEKARGRTAPNPAVGCVIVRDGAIVGEGATRPGGRPHAEAMALERAGARARGASLYVTLEPCAHESERGPTCARLIEEAGIGKVVIACTDPDPRTAGAGIALLRAAGIKVETGRGATRAARSLGGYFTRLALGRPRVTLKLALSIDGKIALPSGESKWLTGAEARADVHRERARADMILVGRGTYEADAPGLDVRLPGLEDWSPRRLLLSRTMDAPEGWSVLRDPADIHGLPANDLLVEGGSGVATAFLKADLVDRILIYRAPILIGEGQSSIGYVGLDRINDAHGRWAIGEGADLGIDRREVYERLRDHRPDEN
ncbi:bifunctional diaminohydroxyphosphoribosylaminopyrimidine deaminase/5-amino-6-(5-phosphoribosylamino)uracil reductase RibD [Sphingomicrobium astaxanthinifaciens]|uniref:bifunctional diaminohydroxyphosphoribosylaminopyrimidine deaminase/5-amino-6-(5-phosphoribosylamino)uracil reductase RibD n=1 Tax=Sphingomicrobium astaxanthinifaciens TaxID=1227949 RepID=UPI001FCCBB33|nr:bifunctional diaminohydroxyphosphoribosylaminopyrimidine deaminase/5-amino-6-(5-phosphoribosylamino)uracil reductase RibD [Sphingomicrobium astaxanthinifaciens]MCJ7421141.1 bifunctional diaminohydroxyphosphoribosylaminopyrimidine deaminase/5-amino-6-(5-phosphoribosylamino)uracil reductase RibD [Sphingomicrobium astaxanthinifaciens]